MRKFLAMTALLALSLAFAQAPLSPVEARSAKDSVKVRQAAMKQNAQNLRAVGGFLKGGKRAGTAETVALRGLAIAAVAEKLPSLFPKGTSLDDLGLKTTGAKPAIWQQSGDFEEAAGRLASLARALSDAAETGDKKKIAAAMGALGKQGCGGCHRTFRMKRPKKK
jgi:cytochrome c556